MVRWKQNEQVEGLCAVIDDFELRSVSHAESGGKRPPNQPIRIPGRREISDKGLSREAVTVIAAISRVKGDCQELVQSD